MEKDKLFIVAVLAHPTVAEANMGVRSVIALPMTPIIAKNESEARIAANRLLPESFANDLSRVEVLVRPF